MNSGWRALAQLVSLDAAVSSGIWKLRQDRLVDLVDL